MADSMSLTEEPMGVERLPCEMLSAVLVYLPQTDLLTARRVCKLWRHQVDEVLGISINIGKSNVYTPNQLVWSSVDVLDHLGVKRCTVGTLDEGGFDLNSSRPEFREPQLVRSIKFLGQLPHQILCSLLEPLPALNRLTLHFSAIEQIHFCKGLSFNSRLLRSLKICSHEIHPSKDRSKLTRGVLNACALMERIESNQLEKVQLDLPFLPELENQLTICVFRLLASHPNTLRLFQLYFGLVVEPKTRRPTSKRGSSTEKEEEVVTSARSNPWVNLAVGRCNKLIRICVALPGRMTLSDLWMGLIASQQNLAEIFFMSEKYGISEGQRSIQANKSTLRKVLLHVPGVASGETRVPLQLDLDTLLSGCCGLSHLLIRGKPTALQGFHPQPDQLLHRLEIFVPVLHNLSMVPKLVSIISLRDIEVEGSQLDWLVNSYEAQLPALKRLRLVDIGTTQTLGIWPTQLNKLVQDGKLEEIEVIRGFNRDKFSTFATEKTLARLTSFIPEIEKTWTFHVRWSEELKEYEMVYSGMFLYRPFSNHLRANDVCNVVFR